MSFLEVASSSVGRLSLRNFDRLAKYIYDYSGIKMPPAKLTMLEGRLRRRLRETGIPDLDTYCDFLFNNDGLQREAIHLIDAVTTNKTDFFREPKHFEHMAQVALPELAAEAKSVNIWSSACSIGAEPYTIAMVMEDYIACTGATLSYGILATDLSTDVLKTARRGVYATEMIAPVSPAQRKRYVLEPKNPARREIRIHPRLRSRIGFTRLNLMDDCYAVERNMHIIFCRNVLIYFDKPTQAKVLGRLCSVLAPRGFLYVGHSESISGIDLPVRQVANTIFRKV